MRGLFDSASFRSEERARAPNRHTGGPRSAYEGPEDKALRRAVPVICHCA